RPGEGMNGKRHGWWIWSQGIAVAMLLAVTLSACISDDDDDPEPTATAPAATAPAAPQASPAGSPVASPAASPVAASPGSPPRPLPTFPPGVSLPISDAICRAQIPNGWVETTPGRGSTLGGDRFILFGGRIADDDAWATAVDLVVQAAPDTAEIEQGYRFVLVTRAEDRGFKYRARFDAIYCDFTVSGSGPIPEEEQADWERIMGSLGPAG
ncbi:MAG: hypothetical protein ACRDJH_17625, partial [Thermomicrobiales bacterium]